VSPDIVFLVDADSRFITDLSSSSLASQVHSFGAFSKWIERQPLVAKLVARAGSPSALEKKDIHGGAEIIFSSVQLVYPSRPERPAIHSLDLHIRAGEKVAFCGELSISGTREEKRESDASRFLSLSGPSGGGKSSILGLLARFYESSRGTVTVDGEDIRAAEISDHYGRIALVSQDAVLYEGTVRPFLFSLFPDGC